MTTLSRGIIGDLVGHIGQIDDRITAFGRRIAMTCTLLNRDFLTWLSSDISLRKFGVQIPLLPERLQRQSVVP